MRLDNQIENIFQVLLLHVAFYTIFAKWTKMNTSMMKESWRKFWGKSGKLDKEEDKIITEILTVLQFGYAEQIL